MPFVTSLLLLCNIHHLVSFDIDFKSNVSVELYESHKTLGVKSTIGKKSERHKNLQSNISDDFRRTAIFLRLNAVIASESGRDYILDNTHILNRNIHRDSQKFPV